MKNSILILSVLFCCNLFFGCSDSDETKSQQFPPKLISIIPKAGSTGGTAIISGVYFSDVIGENEVFINGVQAEITDAAHNRLVIALPDNPVGTYSIKVAVKGETAEGLKFTYASPQAPPELAVLQVMPSSAYAGDMVTLIGQCFSTTLTENQVTINGVVAEVKEATVSQLKIIIPDTEEGSYPICVKTGDKEVKSPLFTYLHTVTLTTSSIAPARGKAGDEITLSGEGFGNTVEENIVTVNGKQAVVKSVTATTLAFIMPENPVGTYPVKVTVADKTVENLSFTYEDFSYTVETVAGNSATTSTDGKGTAASFKFPQGLALAPNGDIWIAERGNNVIRKMDGMYNVSTVAKSGTVTFNAPWQGDFDASGSYYVANKALNNIIKVTQDGTCSVFATGTTFKSPMSVIFDGNDNMYVADRDNKAVKKITPDGTVTSYDMSSLKAGPNCIAIDKKGRLFVGTGGTYQLHMFDTDGTLKTVFGTGVAPTAATYSDGEPNDLSTATMGGTFGITFGEDDVLYIADYTMQTIRTLAPNADGDYAKGTLKTIAGIPGTKGKVDGSALTATFNGPASILVLDKIYVADEQNHLIRAITINK
ncbi:IPT/TIG domain-containing protein [uncultured Bacteroides sp.]|uniref:IPT/TIG domain-containing protein n=1 Tax=uncultured Bacteroides sp. TaxID=162156 RepID=UPI0027DB3754|nr:IPT/TIG domain-containing protein [uncultured Bacteroides sp.]